MRRFCWSSWFSRACCSRPAVRQSCQPLHPQTQSGETFVVALPRIVITFDDQGNPGVEGVASRGDRPQLGRPARPEPVPDRPVLPGLDESGQHPARRAAPDRGRDRRAGQRSTDAAAFRSRMARCSGSSDVAPLLGQNGPAIGQLLQKFAPLVQRLGLSVALKFPTQAGAEAIPYAPADTKVAALAAIRRTAVGRREVRDQVRRSGRAVHPGHLRP